MASHAVQESSLIIIASADGLPVPEHVQGFLDSGLMEQRNRSTLIVAIEESAQSLSDEPRALCTHAGHLATRWQTNFMCCQDRGSHECRQFIAAAIKSRLLEVTACGIHSNRQDGVRSVENASEWDGSSTLNPTVFSLRGEIQKLAYDLWLQDRRPYGKEQEFWFRAEKQIISHIALQEHAS